MLTVVAILGDKLLSLAPTLTDQVAEGVIVVMPIPLHHQPITRHHIRTGTVLHEQVAGRVVYETFLVVLRMVGAGEAIEWVVAVVVFAFAGVEDAVQVAGFVVVVLPPVEVVLLLGDSVGMQPLLIRQYRMPTYVNDYHGYLIEAAAGLLDNASPEERIRLEAEEETGYRVGHVEKIYAAFMSPGSVTERIHFFFGEYQPADQVGAGGGLEAEGEDIEVLELGFEQALGMVQSGNIVDGKTIMLLQCLELRMLKEGW